MKPHMIEFGVLSKGTAKKVFKSIAEGGKPVKSVRFPGLHIGAGYISSEVKPSAIKRGFEAAGMPDQIIKKIKPHTVMVPREKGMSPKVVRKLYKEAGIPDKIRKLSEDPIAIAAHERGHAYGPRVTVKELIKAKDKNSRAAMIIGEERRANQNVMTHVKKHGSESEIEGWRNLSKTQVRQYQGSQFSDVVYGHPLHAAKEVYKKSPWFHKGMREFAARCNVTEFQKDYITTHVKTMPDGRQIDVMKLNSAMENAEVELMPVAALKGLSRSKRDGFSEKRYAKADTRMPIIVDEEGNVVDGRHRAYRAIDSGKKLVPVKRATAASLMQNEFWSNQRVTNLARKVVRMTL